MDARKWQIRKSEHNGGKWCVFAPGHHITAAFVGNSWRHCVNALPLLKRIAASSGYLRRGRYARG